MPPRKKKKQKPVEDAAAIVIPDDEAAGDIAENNEAATDVEESPEPTMVDAVKDPADESTLEIVAMADQLFAHLPPAVRGDLIDKAMGEDDPEAYLRGALEASPPVDSRLRYITITIPIAKPPENGRAPTHWDVQLRTNPAQRRALHAIFTGMDLAGERHGQRNQRVTSYAEVGKRLLELVAAQIAE